MPDGRFFHDLTAGNDLHHRPRRRRQPAPASRPHRRPLRTRGHEVLTAPCPGRRADFSYAPVASGNPHRNTKPSFSRIFGIRPCAPGISSRAGAAQVSSRNRISACGAPRALPMPRGSADPIQPGSAGSRSLPGLSNRNPSPADRFDHARLRSPSPLMTSETETATPRPPKPKGPRGPQRRRPRKEINGWLILTSPSGHSPPRRSRR